MGGLSCSVNLVIAHVNLNSLLNKTNHVFSLLCTSKVDLLSISESWLTSDIPDSFVNLPNYDLVRCDDPDGIRKHGVAIYIHNNLKFNRISSSIKKCYNITYV